MKMLINLLNNLSLFDKNAILNFTHPKNPPIFTRPSRIFFPFGQNLLVQASRQYKSATPVKLILVQMPGKKTKEI
jgi:hypothetical protein